VRNNIFEYKADPIYKQVTTGCITTAHGRFNGIRQVALVCTPT